MRALILDQGLRTPFGHHPNINRALADGFAARGVEAVNTAHRDCAPELLDGLNVRKIFRFSPYDQLSIDPISAGFEGFTTHALSYQFDLMRLSADDWRDVSVVLLMVLSPATLYGYANWWAGLDPATRPRTVAYLCMNSDIATTEPFALQLDTPETRMTTALYRLVGNQIAGFDPTRFVLLGPTDVLAQDFAFLLGAPVHVTPMQMAADLATFDPVAEAFERSDAPPTVGYFGDGRFGKGFNQIPDIVEGVLVGDPTVRLKIQVNIFDWSHHETMGEAYDATVRRIQDIAAREPRVTLLPGFSAIDRYYTELAECDISLQPYSNACYARCVSGIYTEAAFLGRAAVAPNSTWIARQFAQLGGHGAGYDLHHAPAAVAATLDLIQRTAQLRADAPRVRRAWRALHGTDRMIERILTVGTPSPQADSGALAVSCAR
jgi:hypothetical protein